MARYAEDTKVSVAQSRAEVEKIITRYGAERFGFFFDDVAGVHAIQFEMNDRRIMLRLKMPKRSDVAITYTSRGYARSKTAADNAFEAECRRRWRSLNLVLKAKLESVESGIETFEEAFLAHVVLPNGQTVGDYLEPQIEATYKSRQMPPLLPGVDSSVMALPSGQERRP